MQRGTGHHTRLPELPVAPQRHSTFVVLLCRIGQRLTRTISLVHNDGIGQFKNALFNSLQFIATPRQHQQKKKIDHSRDLML